MNIFDPLLAMLSTSLLAYDPEIQVKGQKLNSGIYIQC